MSCRQHNAANATNHKLVTKWSVVIMKSIPRKEKKSFQTERQLEDYCFNSLGLVCLETFCMDWGIWKAYQLSYLYIFWFCFSF